MKIGKNLLCWILLSVSVASSAPASPPMLVYSLDFPIHWLTTGVVSDLNGNTYFAGTSPCGGTIWKVDPAGRNIIWSSCLQNDSVAAVAMDAAGFLYALGHKNASNGNGTSTVFKLTPDTASLITSFTINGTNASSFALDPKGNIYVAGTADASFQTTAGAYSSQASPWFAAKLDAAGAVKYATFLGKHGANAIAVDSKGQPWVVGAACVYPGNLSVTHPYPVCPSITDSSGTSVTVLKLDSSGATALVDKTFGGGHTPSVGLPIALSDTALAIAMDSSDGVWIAGRASSTEIPITPGGQRGGSTAIGGQPVNFGFVLHFSAAGGLLYGSYEGQPTYYQYISGMSVDADGNVYFALSQRENGSCSTASLLTVLSPDGSRILFSRSFKPPVQSLTLDAQGGLYATGTSAITTLAYGAKFDFTKPAGPELTCALSGAYAPGELITLQGTGFPEQPALSFDGYPAPLLYASATQIDAVIPFEVTQGRSAVSFDGTVVSNLLIRTPAPVVVGRAVNQDGSVNSSTNPAKAGSAIAVYLTGLGVMTPPLLDGQLGPSTPPFSVPLLGMSAVIGPGCRLPYVPLSSSCIDARIEFAGQAPGIIAGVVQVNVRIPDGTASGYNPMGIYAGLYETVQAGAWVQ